MREWLDAISEPIIVIIDAFALLIIVAGTAQAAFKVVTALWNPLGEQGGRKVFLGYARWLVAALTFQLAADIIETSVSTSWQTIGRVGLVALIRTFLNYFLERDVEKDMAAEQAAPPPPAA
jgi:uncharacterized membrane protein